MMLLLASVNDSVKNFLTEFGGIQLAGSLYNGWLDYMMYACCYC
jgi:hypothetical protein